MNYFKKFLLIISFLFMLVLGLNISFATEKYSAGNDFFINVNSLSDSIYNNNMDNVFTFNITNTLSTNQRIIIKFKNISGWDINSNYNDFYLKPKETREIRIRFKANSEFDYSASVLSSDTIVITNKDEYQGVFKFPIFIIGKNENMSLRYQLNIEKLVLEPEYDIRISTEDLSPVSPLKFVIESKNLNKPTNVEVYVLFDGKKLFSENKVFSKDNYYQVFTEKIGTEFNPGIYDVDVIVRSKLKGENLIKEWKASKKLKVIKFKKLDIKENKFESYFRDVYVLNINNLGNTPVEFKKEINFSYFKSLFFNSNVDFKQRENGVEIVKDLKKGEKVRIEYYFNYIPLYIFFLIFFIFIGYYYIRKNSNPLVVDTKLYDIKKVEFEGVKSFKVRIGFENIKQKEIEDLKVIFRMPSYLSVKDKSFSLSEPNKVLKGRNQFKLIWDFKRFEYSDSRILGFALENKKGILGDIKLPDLEFEVKIDGKIRRYYFTFPTIKG